MFVCLYCFIHFIDTISFGLYFKLKFDFGIIRVQSTVLLGLSILRYVLMIFRPMQDRQYQFAQSSLPNFEWANLHPPFLTKGGFIANLT